MWDGRVGAHVRMSYFRFEDRRSEGTRVGEKGESRTRRDEVWDGVLGSLDPYKELSRRQKVYGVCSLRSANQERRNNGQLVDKYIQETKRESTGSHGEEVRGYRWTRKRNVSRIHSFI